MSGLSLKLNEGLLKEKQGKLAKILGGSTPYFRPHLKRVGLRIRKWHVDNFASRGTMFSFTQRQVLGWKPVSWVTAILRRGGKKLTTWDQIHAHAKTVKQLSDTGDLKRAVMGSSSGAVFKQTNMSISVGVAGLTASLLNDGGLSTFRFTSSMEARVRRNISETTGRGKPVFQPKGRYKEGGYRKYSNARKNWNPVLFQVLGYLRKKSGSTVKIPPRQFILKDRDITPARRKELQDIITATDREIRVKL